MNNVLLKVLNSTPINRQSALVTSQKHCVDIELEIGRDDISLILKRLQRKRQLLNFVLGISSKSTAKNVKTRYNSGRTNRSRPSRAVEEYVKNGKNISTLVERLALLDKNTKETRKRLGAIESAWKAEHPGWVFEGIHCVAPNGEIFSKANR